MHCRRRQEGVATFFLLLFFLPSSSGFPSTKIKIGPYDFNGSVKCASGNRILTGAKIVLMERDEGTGVDFLTESLIQNGIFKLSGTADDGWLDDYLEVYVNFYDVCKTGEFKRSGTLNVDGITHYTILDNDDYDIAVDDTSG